MPRLSKIGAAALAAFGWTSGSSVTASYLAVAGGGGGGGMIGGGGGAGGYQAGTTSLNPTLSYTVIVGAGGAGTASAYVAGNQGNNSSFSTITANAGGKGGIQGGATDTSGGSSGGAGGFGTRTGTASQGNLGGTSGWSGAGGGGAGAVGADTPNSNVSGGAGGAGTANSITGTSVTYAGGGGGGGYRQPGGAGGSGGGGAGGAFAGGIGVSGTANLGGGGGGGGDNSPGAGGAGGSGVVIISYVGAQQFGGGVVTSSGGNTIHTFNTSGTLSPLSSLTANFLVIAGGGAGADYGGGGAGGLRSSVTATGGGGSLESALTIDTNSIYVVTVGGGGTGGSIGTNGSDSVFLSITSTGGGKGANNTTPTINGSSGGSGGGGRWSGGSGGAGTANQGFAGGAGGGQTTSFPAGGGGGAGAVGGSGTTGGSGGNGGNGVTVNITGSSVIYAGGGGGGCAPDPSGVGGSGGSGGGGTGGTGGSGDTEGALNKGSGGGGAGSSTSSGSNGGSGIVIISYAGSTQLMAGGTVTVAGGNVIHTFTSSGYLTPIVLVTKSLRFRSSATAYLNRTGGTSTNRKIHTFSFWTKYSVTGGTKVIASAGSDDNNREWLGFDSNNFYYQVKDSGNFYELGTSQVLRDPSAWYHLMVAVDTTQATSSNRVKMYINGVQVTAFGTSTYPLQNDDLFFNDSVGGVSYIGALRGFVGSVGQYDGYLAEFNFIDGQQLTPSSFGTTSDLGVWQPIRYGGSYGTNGFYLKFTDTTSTSTLGTDFSPNGNTWTVNNISLTSGSTYDSMTDVPTLTSATTANYAVMNPLANTGIGTLSNGNLQLVTSTNSKTITGTLALPSTGQYYWEITATDYITDNGTFFGVVNQEFLTGAPSNGTWLGFNTYSATYNNGTSTDTNGLTGTNVTNDGDIWCIAVDVTNNKFWIGRSRSGTLVWADGVTPAVNGSGATTLSLPTGNLYPMAYRGGSDNETYNFNFGQQPFAQTPPTGFVALNTFNLPTPTIGATASSQANDYFNVVTYSGNSANPRSITGVNFQPDWVWVKDRTQATNHRLVDAVRGGNNTLKSNTTDAETASEAAGTVSAFTSDGFTLAGTSNMEGVNLTGDNYVAWNWKANGAGSTNTAGSITSQVSANTTAGFSIVTYTGTGSNATVGHGLGVAPSMIITKPRNVADNWISWHTTLGATGYIYLNLTNASATGATVWNSTLPTSTVFSIGTSSNINSSGQTQVAYCFAQVAGYSAFGSYTGNGSTDGPFVFLGFRPRWVMVKNITSAQSWQLMDTSRSTYNVATANLLPNSSSAELTGTDFIDMVSNGFKIRQSSAGNWNNSGATYIYACFAENPFKYANAR